jgi:polysaccharide export outer membrane protein
VPSEQISILEAIGQAGDLTIFGLRDNVMLIRQEGPNKIVKRLNLNSSGLLESPYFFLRSNDVIYVEPGKAKVSSTDQSRQYLPIIFSGLSIIVVILTSLLK